jgi:glycosyltransferase involved in cell wall biosynthesis
MDRRYVIVTPVRNEDCFIEGTIQSVLGQTELPTEWVIVDDGSTDRTREIVAGYAARYEWIHLVELPVQGNRELGGRVVRAFTYGGEQLRAQEWGFTSKLDADLTLPDNYYQFLLDRFEENNRYGILSGCTYLRKGDTLVWERASLHHTRGAMKLWRRTCLEDIGGITPELGWDVIDDFAAQARGWETRNFRELRVIHHRPMGSSIRGSIFGKLRYGRIHYLLNYHPIFALGSAVYRMWEPPYIIGGFAVLYGYLSSLCTRRPRIVTGELKTFIRRRQMDRIKGGLRRLLPWRTCSVPTDSEVG